MAAAACLLTEDQFLCAICLDVFTDPVSTPCGHNFCKNCINEPADADVPFQCPLCMKMFYPKPELQVNTLISEMVEAFRQKLVKMEAELQQTIEEMRLKIEELKRSVELGKEDADREMADGVQVFAALKEYVEKLTEAIGEKQRQTELQAEGFIRKMEQDIRELKKRKTEVELLSVLQLEEPLSEEMKEKVPKMLARFELRRVQSYAVDVTFDPDTANPYLVLSDDGKQVHDSDVRQKLPDNPERFSYCINVLGEQSFSSGRFYFEVQVKGKTEWTVGVATEATNRKAQITLSPRDGFWTVRLRGGYEYKAKADPDVALSRRSGPEKVGVFVDYDEGLVSFYDVDTAALIYSFTGCSFTQKLHPFFSPGLNDDGRNSAPLIITPID
ncbi:E3 ubiquitin-protein ligase TRIM21-like [Neolamprologus brichardi]|uniref:E3 ubiquitin-protein ligase TRIM21-like n=1 Tax=Neolamprologus brichardi TaxID=32507 RepID=UPI001643F59D|nr:E3 ubiquitin-protein ligase TRIM21-like [Neolamprologus brichardi]